MSRERSTWADLGREWYFPDQRSAAQPLEIIIFPPCNPENHNVFPLTFLLPLWWSSFICALEFRLPNVLTSLTVWLNGTATIPCQLSYVEVLTLPPTPSPSSSEGSREGSPGLGALGQGLFSYMAQVRPCTPHKSYGGGGQDIRGMWLRCDLIHPQELTRKTYQFLKPM